MRVLIHVKGSSVWVSYISKSSVWGSYISKSTIRIIFYSETMEMEDSISSRPRDAKNWVSCVHFWVVKTDASWRRYTNLKRKRITYIMVEAPGGGMPKFKTPRPKKKIENPWSSNHGNWSVGDKMVDLRGRRFRGPSKDGDKFLFSPVRPIFHPYKEQ